jgi:hypothetical protein
MFHVIIFQIRKKVDEAETYHIIDNYEPSSFECVNPVRTIAPYAIKLSEAFLLHKKGSRAHKIQIKNLQNLTRILIINISYIVG